MKYDYVNTLLTNFGILAIITMKYSGVNTFLTNFGILAVISGNERSHHVGSQPCRDRVTAPTLLAEALQF